MPILVLQKITFCLGLILVYISTPSLAWSDVGTACSSGDECEPGEVCAPGRLPEDPSFCTRRCGPDRPCPDAFVCESSGGLALCNTPIEYSELGEECAPSCAEGLLCLDDGNERYCSLSCTLPGSCPEGYRCRPGSLNACAKIGTLPSIGEPCTEAEGCSADYQCLALPNRTLSYCTYGCEEISCPPFMVCDGEGEEARCIHTPYVRALGDSCVNEAHDASTVGCADMLSCERDRDQSVCTRDCTRNNPCPDDFGCVDRPNSEDLSIGRCMPGVESSPGLEPLMSTQMPQAGTMMNENTAGELYNEPLPMTDPSTADTTAATEDDSSSCDQGKRHRPDLMFMLWSLLAYLYLNKIQRKTSV